MKNLLRTIILLTTTIFVSSCDMETNMDMDMLNGEATELSFSESAQMKVVQDTYIANLRFEAKGEKADAIQSQVNEKMQFAMKTATSKNIKTSTGTYQVNKNWDRVSNKYVGWVASQQIILESSSKKELEAVTGQLQESGFMVNNLDSYLSEEKKASYRNQLIEEALERVKHRAEIIAGNLGKAAVSIVSVNVAPTPNYYNPPMRKRMLGMAESMATPVVKAAEDTISINISVTALLK